MDDDSCGKFIGSLTKYLQSLCHSYVDFDNGVELVGYIYLNVDTGKKIDYVLNESVCKNGANVVKFTSNSYHAKAEEKQKKETPKKADPQKEAKKKTDDDDVIIVGSEGSRRNRPGSSPSRHHNSPNQNQMQQRQGMGRPNQPSGMFRQPRGPNPRMGSPLGRQGAYPYQPRQRLNYPNSPRNFMNMNAGGYSPRIRQPQYQPRGPQPQPMRGANPVDTDVAFMREEYVGGQPANRPGPQAGGTAPAPGQQPYPYQAQRYMAPYNQTQPSMSLPQTMGQQGGPTTAVSSQEAASTATAAQPVANTIFDQALPVSSSGGMPLPVTTHTIFDSGPVMSAAAEVAGNQPAGEGAGNVAGEQAVNVEGVPVPVGAPIPAEGGFMIGQVWSGGEAQPAAAPAPATYGQAGVEANAQPMTAPATDAAPGQTGFEVYDQQQPGVPVMTSSSPFSPTAAQPQAPPPPSSEGDGFSALVSELAAFNEQQANTASAAAPAPQPTDSAQQPQPPAPTPTPPTDAQPPAPNPAPFLEGGRPVKHDPDAPPSIATSVLHEATEAAASQAPQTFVAPAGTGAGPEGYRKRSGSSSSQSRGTPSPSPSSGSLVGPESVVIETKPFLQQASSDDSGCDTASASTAERLASPLPATPSTSSSLKSLSIPLVAVDSPSSSTLKRVDVKQERLDGEELEAERRRLAQEEVARSLEMACSLEPMKPRITESQQQQLRPAAEAEGAAEKPDQQEKSGGEVERSRSTESSDWRGSKAGGDSDWVTDFSGALNSDDDSMDEEEEPQDDEDDPNYTPGRPIDSEKGGVKRTRAKGDKVTRGKRRRVDAVAGDEGQEEDLPPGNEEEPPASEDGEHPGQHSPPPDHSPYPDEQEEEGDSPYKPGTFILVNMTSKDSERSSRMRPVHTPAEVIVAPEGESGTWVHTLIQAGSGLWRLPSVDQLQAQRVHPGDVVRVLENANVRITGTKVFYKFDDIFYRTKPNYPVVKQEWMAPF